MLQKWTCIILITALIAKDTLHIGDPFIMRGFAQILCLLVALIWIAQGLSVNLAKRFLIIFAYLFVLALSGLGSEFTSFVLLQVLSLASVVLFFIAYWSSINSQIASRIIIRTTVYLYSLAVVISLVLFIFKPSLVHEQLIGGGIRFSGLFPKSGMMAIAAGLLAGIAWFGRFQWWTKYPVSIAAIICLALTQSRTFWVALIIAGLVTAWIYSKNRRWIGVVTVIGILSVISLFAFDISIDKRKMNEVVRIESLSHLSGRLDLWKAGFEQVKESPLLGHGFTVGGSALQEHIELQFYSNRDSGRSVARQTLHNGYLQSILDSGFLGFILYLSIIFIALWRLFARDKKRNYPVQFYSLLFLTVANFGETAIYAASVYSSVIFWAFAIFALSIRRT